MSITERAERINNLIVISQPRRRFNASGLRFTGRKSMMVMLVCYVIHCNTAWVYYLNIWKESIYFREKDNSRCVHCTVENNNNSFHKCLYFEHINQTNKNIILIQCVLSDSLLNSYVIYTVCEGNCMILYFGCLCPLGLIKWHILNSDLR